VRTVAGSAERAEALRLYAKALPVVTRPFAQAGGSAGLEAEAGIAVCRAAAAFCRALDAQSGGDGDGAPGSGVKGAADGQSESDTSSDESSSSSDSGNESGRDSGTESRNTGAQAKERAMADAIARAALGALLHLPLVEGGSGKTRGARGRAKAPLAAAVAPDALVAAGGAWWPGLAVSPSELLQAARLLSAAPPVGMRPADASNNGGLNL